MQPTKFTTKDGTGYERAGVSGFCKTFKCTWMYLSNTTMSVVYSRETCHFTNKVVQLPLLLHTIFN